MNLDNDCAHEMRISVMLRQSFPKLEYVLFSSLSKVNNNDLKEFLKVNPQLKKIGLEFCKNNCFRCVATHVPDIETLKISFRDHKIIEAILKEIHASNVSLQHLHLHGCSYFVRTEQLEDAISKLKTLKALWLFELWKLEWSHILRLCQQLEELAVFQLGSIGFIMSAEDLLEIVKFAPKLQSLQTAMYCFGLFY